MPSSGSNQAVNVQSPGDSVGDSGFSARNSSFHGSRPKALCDSIVPASSDSFKRGFVVRAAELVFHLNEQLDLVDGNVVALEDVGEAILAQRQGQRLVAGSDGPRVQEAMPFTREIVPCTEQPRQAVLSRGFDDGVQRILLLRHRLLLERAACFPRGVAEVQHHVRDRVVVKGPERCRQLDVPLADGAGAFEGQVALVAQVGLEQPTVLLAAACDNGLDGADAVGESRRRSPDGRTCRPTACCCGERSCCSGSACRGRLCKGRRRRGWSRRSLDAAHVVAGIAQVEQRFGNAHEALAGLLELKQSRRIELGQRDVLGDLVLRLFCSR